MSNNRAAWSMVVLAGAAACAWGEPNDIVGIRKLAQPIHLNMDGTPATPRYSPRAVLNTYDTATTTGFDYAFLGDAAGSKQVIEDISFAPGPWATAPVGGRIIREFQIALGNTSASAASFDCIVNFYNSGDFSFAGFSGDSTPMLNPGATPFATLRLNPGTVPNNQGADYVFDVSAANVTIPNSSCVVQCIITSVGGTAQAAPTDPGTFIFETNTRQANAALPGTTVADYGRDNPNNAANLGVVIGLAAGPCGGPCERRTINLPPIVGLGLRIAGEVGTLTPPASQDIAGGTCNLSDGTTTASATLASGEVKWYRVCLTGNATDDTGRFVDIETAGTDVAIGLYASSGVRIASDEDSGEGTAAQLSFGLGRRQALGPDGAQFDGRHFTDGLSPSTDIKGLSAGTYFLAVAPSGSAFGDGFTVAPEATGGPVTINVTTNVIGGALAASVAPKTTADLGVFPTPAPIVLPGGQIPTEALGPFGVKWTKFDLCRPASPTNPVTINTNGTTVDVGSAILLFNSSGAEIARSVSTTTAPAPLTFATNGSLPNGTYYLAQVYYLEDAGNPILDVVPSGRWHVRSRVNNAGFDFAGEISVAWATCCHGACTADFDDGSATGTPDGGVGIEDLLYYLGVYDGGVSCADVDDGSSTGVEDGGVGIEDLLYYLSRYDAGC